MAWSFLRLVGLLPVTAILYGIGIWGGRAGGGLAYATLPWLAVAIFGLVFVGGWVGIPVLGGLSTVLAHEFSPSWQRRLKATFVGWTSAWIGTALAVWLWGTPFDL